MTAANIVRHMKLVTKFNTSFVSETDVTHWKITVLSSDCPDILASALRKAKCTRIVFGIKFDDQFPISPPFVYVLEPSFVPMTGHVLQGGGICTKMLTDAGWLPTMRIQTLIESIVMLMNEGKPRVECVTSHYNERDARESLKRAKSKYAW